MSLTNRFIILSCWLFSSAVYAHEILIEPLYWRATDSVDWAYLNSLTTPNQTISYKTVSFSAAPGLRVGSLAKVSAWDMQLYYTTFHTNGNDAATGNLTSAFLGAKLAAPSSTYFYQSGQVNASINYNMIDVNVGKSFNITNTFMLRPLIGLEGGWISQTFNTQFQGTTSVVENIDNNFSGIGPKIGLNGKLTILKRNHFQANLIATFATSYLLGYWTVTDNLTATPPKNVDINVANRSAGSLSLQAMVGLSIDVKNWSLKAGYEINDWFNQCQIFDDATGAHNNDLQLQGLTLNLTYRF